MFLGNCRIVGVRMNYVVTQPLRSISRFEGDEGPTGVWDFEEDVRLALGGHPYLTDAAKVDIILGQLGPLPRAEIRCHGPDVLQSPDAIFVCLHETFGDRRLFMDLMTDLIHTTQSTGQSLLEYSHHVHTSWRTLNRAQEKRGELPLPEKQFVDIFICGIIDPMTRKMISYELSSHPDLPFTFKSARKLALVWESDSAAAPAASPTVLTVPPPTPTGAQSAVMPQTVDTPRPSTPSPSPSRDLPPKRPRRRRRKRRTLSALMALKIMPPRDPLIRDCISLPIYNDVPLPRDEETHPGMSYSPSHLPKMNAEKIDICPPPPAFNDFETDLCAPPQEPDPNVEVFV